MSSQTIQSYLIFLPKKDFSEEEYTAVKKRLLKAGKKIFITSDDHSVCSGNKGMKVKSDTSFFNVNTNNFCTLILIGGSGSRNYWKNDSLHNIIRKFNDSNKTVAAICSAPVILAKAGILQNKSATCFSEDKKEMINSAINYQDRNVVTDGNIVTANGPQSVLQFIESVLHLNR